MMTFDKSLRNAGHTRRYSIQATANGWEVREEQDSRLVTRVEYSDWHRVERARRAMAWKLAELQETGWVVV